MANNSILNQAKTLQNDLVNMRRYLHKNAETGFDLSATVTFVKDELKKMGYEPKACGKAGLIATVGSKQKSGKTVLLRADMDALPITEKTDERFASKNGNMHACGHDLHTAMLLGAAKLLKDCEGLLKGTVKLMFQPAEELLEGAKNMIDDGALNSPEPLAAMMIHVMTGVELPTGSAVISSEGVSAPAADYFTIKVQGKSCHGSAPWNGIDALLTAAHILVALQQISARETPLSQSAVLTIGSIKTPDAPNAVPDFAIMQGTLRTFDEEFRQQIKLRMEQICKNVAKAFRAKVKISYGGGCPTLVNDKSLCKFAYVATKKLLGNNSVFTSSDLTNGTKSDNGGSEDFAYVSHKIPSVMIALCAGEKAKGYKISLHNPKTRFDESVLYIGSALYANFAINWLKSN